MKPRVISLFSGAGGLDYGFEAAGFQTAAAVEFDHDCCETLRTSRPKWNVVERNIFDVSTAEMLERASCKPGEVDLVVGGPPCQPFSKAGYWSRGDALRLDDPRADTLSAYVRVVEEALPHAFLLENVEGLAYSGKDEGLRLLLTRIADINKRTKSQYRPVFQVVSAAVFGVPQLRERVILIAARDGTIFRFPTPTHGDPDEEGLLPGFARAPYRTAWDAIGDVVPDPGDDLEMRGKWAELLPSIPEGSNYLHHTKRGAGLPLFGWRRRYWSFLLKLAKNRPSWTIQAQPGPAIGPFHWQSRRLSVRELSRLQTFPDDVRFAGGRTSIQKQIGNAVPSLMAEVLGRAIRTQLLGLPSMRRALKLLPPDRSPAPPPEPTGEVPLRFYRLIGDHSPHPGTGKGHRALGDGSACWETGCERHSTGACDARTRRAGTSASRSTARTARAGSPVTLAVQVAEILDQIASTSATDAQASPVGAVFHADNLELLRCLPGACVDLVYIDPPFNTGRVQTRRELKTTRTTGQADRVGFKGNGYTTQTVGTKSFEDRFDDYLAFIEPRLEHAHRVLKPTGSLFLHIDFREVHYCKLLLDHIFGRDAFVNEIIWAYDYGARSKKRWSPKHDNILWYARNPGTQTFNYDAIDRIPYLAPGLVTKEKAARGKTVTDTWWNTIVSPTGKEKTGYPTQKPLAIIRRIVAVHSRPGDVVLDFFAGSGTVGEACATLGRHFVLVDNNPVAVNVMKKRLSDAKPKFFHAPMPTAY